MKTRALLAAAALSLALTGCGAPAPDAPADTTPGPAAPAPAAQLDPVFVDVAAIDAHSTLIPLGLDSARPDCAPNCLQVPDVHTPQQAGWFSLGARPGYPGPAVIVGHVNGDRKPGVFTRLKAIKVGDTAVVTRSDQSQVTYRINRVLTVSKTEFPSEAVYGPVEDAQIRLITCGGDYDAAARRYLDSVIAFGGLAT